MVLLSRSFTITLLFGSLVLSAPLAKADTEDPIDSTLDACLASGQGQTNAGMITCTTTAINAWDAKLNQIYQQDLTTLDPTSRGLLRASERQWVAFRNAERAAQAGPWRTERGDDINIQILGNDLSSVKERAGELTIYLPSN